MKHVMIVMALLVTLVLQASSAHGAMQPPIPSPPSFPESSGPPPLGVLGVIDDSIANRLTIGMSDSEVFAFAGPPKFPVRELTLASRWVYVVGDDLLELTFGSGQIVQIKRFRQQSAGTVQ
jgi:hypothetical protein